MNFKPILFSTDMVRAIIQNRKTMTRRKLKEKSTALQWLTDGFTPEYICSEGNEAIRPYNVGDILWVREKFFGYNEEDENEYVYFADAKDARPWDLSDAYCINEWGLANKECWPKWKPSLFMPKAACRIFLEITDVRVERLQNITEMDAASEGIEYLGRGWKSYETIPSGKYKGQPHPHSELANSTAVRSFMELWESLNGEHSWSENPWVWVISFKRIDKPENFK